MKLQNPKRLVLPMPTTTAAPWARETKNVKKPQSQMCESCRKLI